jgi:hypothetical protein
MRGYGPAATAFLLVALTLAAGCSSGSDSSSTQSPDLTLSGTASPTVTDIITASPTETATPKATENNPYGIAPAFDNPNDPNDPTTVVHKVNTALRVSNTVPFGDMGIFQQRLDSCNEVNVQFDDSITTYDLAVVSSCGSVFQALAQMYTENQAPEEIKDATDSVESFTFGTNGKIEDLNSREKLTLSFGTPPTVAGYEARIYDTYFSPRE